MNVLDRAILRQFDAGIAERYLPPDEEIREHTRRNFIIHHIRHGDMGRSSQGKGARRYCLLSVCALHYPQPRRPGRDA